MKLVYLHGHGASADSFNFIRSQVVDHDAICLEYDSADGFYVNKAAMVGRLKDESGIFFVAHSMGGKYALHLADALGDQVLGAVTLATPYGGCESALALNFYRPHQLYKDIHPTATPVTQGRLINLFGLHWTAIVTTRGQSHLISAANDGVVTRDSMYSRRGARFIEVESTHNEVLQSMRTVEIIRAALAEVDESQVAT